MNLSGIEIEAVVAEVLRRVDEQLRSASASSPAAPVDPAPARPSPSEKSASTPASSTASSQAPSGAPGNGKTPGELRISEKLLTWNQVRDQLRGIKRVVVGERCVVTPAVRDGLRSAGIELVRSQLAPTPSALRSVRLVAHAADVDVAGVVDGVRGRFRGLELSRETDLQKVVSQLATATGSTSLAIVITRQAAAAIILANRRRSLRAILAASEAQVAEAARSTAANVLVIDPAGRSELELIRLIETFDRAATTDCPAWLR